MRLSASELAPRDLVDLTAIDRASGESGHHTFHHTAEVFRAGRIRFRDHRIDGRFDLSRTDGRRQIGLERPDFRGLARDEIRPAPFGELLD